MISFDNELGQYRQAARDAYQGLGQLTGVPLLNRQQHLQALRNMTPDDLDMLADEYGVDQVAHYIANLAGGHHALR